MRSREIGERDLRPPVPARTEKALPRISPAQRELIGEDRRTVIDVALMCRHHVSKGWTLDEDVVPGHRKAARRGTIAQGDVRHHPRAVSELADVGWRRLAPWLHE